MTKKITSRKSNPDGAKTTKRPKESQSVKIAKKLIGCVKHNHVVDVEETLKDYGR